MECEQCGDCCKRFPIFASSNDIRRWFNRGRTDILKKFYVVLTDGIDTVIIRGDKIVESDLSMLGEDGDIGEHDSISKSNGECPFLRKRGKLYVCSIHDDKPQLCIDYKPWEWDLDQTSPHNRCPVVRKSILTRKSYL
jgi:Fe-S-cluster containining protein